jgi:hypothetical protein
MNNRKICVGVYKSYGLFLKNMKNYLFGCTVGFILGFTVLHPVGMLLQGAIHPVFNLRFDLIKEAFNPHHLPMAFFFGVLGSFTGCLIGFFQEAIHKQKERVKILEGLLPICSYCKKIRDDDEKEHGSGDWIQFEKYISQRSKTQFSHGICPICYEQHVKENVERIQQKEKHL